MRRKSEMALGKAGFLRFLRAKTECHSWYSSVQLLLPGLSTVGFTQKHKCEELKGSIVGLTLKLRTF